MTDIYVSHFTAWAPGLSNDKQKWQDWALDKCAIACEHTLPALEFTDSLFRRRLSQLSRMTIQVVHDMVAESHCDKDINIVFASFRGELKREYSIDYTLIDEARIYPSSFSLSVFNTPIAMATICEKLTGGYSAVYPSQMNFMSALLSAVAPVLSGKKEKILFVYGDEFIIDEYALMRPKGAEPFAFAVLLSKEPGDTKRVHFSLEEAYKTPQEFLKKII
ncbi:MAG: beta-ketoacyl synthase chain length factor, partial [Treponema sp.]|nr:beta-ketoacyl synthase chain length factor [Treponema sp.]